MSFRIPRGTVDIMPGEVETWQYIEEKVRDLCHRCHFSEVRTPIFEQTDLFRRGVGETTDIVEKEMYTFTDRGGRSLTLRPEGTASLVRSFVEKKIYGEPQPTKWYYIGPMYRYERPQAGRQRQFHQFGVEVFGTTDPGIDAEVIDLGVQFYTSLGLKNIQVELNSVGCSQCRPLYREKLVEFLAPKREELCNDCQSRLERNPMRILDCKNESCQRVTAKAPRMAEHLCEDCASHFKKVQEYLKLLGVEYRIDTRMVRGLDYYTQTAFEFTLDGQGGSLGGGGRYNGLVQEIGGPEVSGIGFGLGLERTVLALKEQKVDIPVERGIDLFLIAWGEEPKRRGIPLLKEIRQAGFSAERDYLDRKFKGQMKTADRMKARYVAILGEDELKENRIAVKHLETGNQETIELNQLVAYMRQGRCK